MCFDKQNTVHRGFPQIWYWNSFFRWFLKGFSPIEYVHFLEQSIKLCFCRTHLICVRFSIGIRLELFSFFFFGLPPRDFPHYIEYVHFHHTDRSNTQLEVALKCMATYIIHICTVWVLGLHLKGHKVSASNFWPW